MTKFIRFCIDRPVFVWCSVALFVMLGLAGYGKLGVTLYPDISPPLIMLRTAYEGASPGEIERLITKPLEDAVADLEGLKSMTSYSQDGVSLIDLDLATGLDVDLKMIDVENKIKLVKSELPQAAEEPVVMKVSVAAVPFLVASFTSNLPETVAKEIVKDHIKPAVSRVEGVGRVGVAGGLDREIQVILDPAAMSDYKISYQDVCRGIAANNLTMPAGYVVQDEGKTSLRMTAEYHDLTGLSHLLLPAQNGHPVPLSLLGKVVDAASDRKSIARANGRSVVQLQIAGRTNADIVAVGAACKKAIARLLTDLPELSVEYTLDDTEFVQASIKNVIRDSILGIALTALVIYLFLARLPATLVIAAAMPIAFAATFFPMQAHGFSLNLMTTLALALSMGVLVDNAILVLENIYRYRDMGFAPFEAAEKGAAEISTAVLAGVLTNVGVFLPIVMISGIIGQLLVPYAITILYATVFSLWVTLAVVPSMTARLIEGDRSVSRRGYILTAWWGWLFDGLQDLFMTMLEKALKYPVRTLVAFLSLTIGAFYLAGDLGFENLPTSDDGSITISLKLSNHASIAQTEEKTIAVETFIRSLPEAEHIGHIVSAIGAGDADQELYKSTISLNLKESPHRPRTIDVANKIRSYLETVEAIEFSVLAVRPGFVEDPIMVHVQGDDMSVLFGIAEQIRNAGEKIPGILDLSLSTEMGKPELRISPVRWRLVQLDMDIADLTEIVKGYLNGNGAGRFRQDGSEFDIKVRVDLDKAGDIHAAGQLPITTKYGVVPLEEMADLHWSDSPAEIRRVERKRTLMITGNVQHISIGEGIDKMRELIGTVEIPPGYSARMAGEADDMSEEAGEMERAILMAVIVTFLVVASILESWALAVMILLCVPVSAIGVVPLMLATGANVSLFSMIGMIMLVGLVVNSAILVVDTAERLRKEEGFGSEAAIKKACEIRFQSVVMALVTSVVSFLPLALASGRGAEFRWPIAVVAIGGLVAGGFLSLLLVPSIYKMYWGLREQGKEDVPGNRNPGIDAFAASSGR